MTGALAGRPAARPERRARRSARRSATSPRRGFTIVELVVAILILSTGLLALAGTSTYVVRQMAGGSLQTVASTMVQSRFDSLSSVKCTTLATTTAGTKGTNHARGVTESWAVVDGANTKILYDTVRFAGRVKPLVYRSLIHCRN